MRYCINCGTMNDNDANFCSGCGKKFEIPAPEPVESPVAQVAEAVEAPAAEAAETVAQAAEPVATPVEKATAAAGAMAAGVGAAATGQSAGQPANEAASTAYNGGAQSYTNNDPYGYRSQYNGNQSFTDNTYNGRGISSSQYNGYSIASLVLGICSIAFSFIIPVLPLAAGIVGLVLGNKAKKYGDNGRAKAGRITSIIGIILIAVQFVIIIIAVIAITDLAFSNPTFFEDIYNIYY